MKNRNKIGFSLLGFFLFFMTIATTTSCSILIFDAVRKVTEKKALISLAVLGSILAGTLVCVVIDIFRRKFMVDKPTSKILYATSEIAKGNFDVKLEIKHSHKKFDEYDKIMENINKMAEELNKNEVLKTDFVSNVSHEIKTPLSVIQNYSMILQNDKLSKQERDKFLGEMISATKRLSNLITNILKLNKLENQKLDFELAKFNLGEELRLLVLNFEDLIDKKQIELVCEINDVSVFSSKELLEIVWNNILSNAIKFTPEKGKIAVELKENNEFAEVKITDTGIGMNKETGKHIFDKFYQGDTSHSGEGNGLGLALVKKVIDILGGEISVESELNKGTTFTVKIKKD